MPTLEHRASYTRSKLCYPGDLTDEDGSLAQAGLSRSKPCGNKGS